MTAQPGRYIASNNAGELAPELHGRTDLKQFYAGLSYARNIEPVPQGGSRLSPRTRHVSRLRKVLAAPTPDSTGVDLTHSAAGTVKEATFTTAQDICAVTIAGLSCDVDVEDLLTVQWTPDGMAWNDFSAAFGVSTAARDYRFALAPGESVAATGLRLRLTGAPPSPATFTATAFTPHVETDSFSDLRLRPFTFSRTQAYVFALTEDHIDIWRDGAFVGAAPGLTAAQLAEAWVTQRFDTMLLFHDDVETARILRDGADHRWPRDLAPFSTIPQVDLGGSYDNAVVDEWDIALEYLTSGEHSNARNSRIVVSVNGDDAPAIITGTGSADWDAFRDDLEAALESMPAVKDGITVTAGVNGDTYRFFRVAFTGAGNAGHFTLTARCTNNNVVAASATNITVGIRGGEPLMSADAGWPACGAFAQDRLITAGFRGKKSALLLSQTGEYYEQNIDSQAPSAAILLNLDTAGAEQIHAIANARHPIFFTEDAEYFISTRPIDRNQPVNLVNTSRYGTARGVPIVEHEGELIVCDRARGQLRSVAYDDQRQAYVSDPLTLLAAHIVAGVVDQALQRPTATAAAGRLWIVRDDGTVTLGTLIRGQDVLGFTRWQTDGAVKAACVDGANEAYLAVARTVDGATALHLEKLEAGLLFDGVIAQTYETATTAVENLEPHEGATVWAVADGFVVGPFTVTDGAITLARAASAVAVGRWTAPDARTLPIPRDVAERTELRRPMRVHSVKLDLIDTTSIAIGANGEAADTYALYRAGDPTDAPPPPFTGAFEDAQGLVGFSDEGIVQITQTRPGDLQWRKITVEAKL